MSRSGTNIMGEPMVGRTELRIHVITLDQLRRVRDTAAEACDAWSDGDDDAYETAVRRLGRAYRKWHDREHREGVYR